MNMPTVTKRRSAPLGNRGRLVTVAAPKCAHCRLAMAAKIYPDMPKRQPPNLFGAFRRGRRGGAGLLVSSDARANRGTRHVVSGGGAGVILAPLLAIEWSRGVACLRDGRLRGGASDHRGSGLNRTVSTRPDRTSETNDGDGCHRANDQGGGGDSRRGDGPTSPQLRRT